MNETATCSDLIEKIYKFAGKVFGLEKEGFKMQEFKDAIRVFLEHVIEKIESVNLKYFEEENLYKQLVDSYKNIFMMIENNFLF